MMRIKIPQGIVTGPQMRALADVATKYSRGFSHITTRQNIQYHFVLLKDAELAMRDLGRGGDDHARGVRQLRPQHHRVPVRRRRSRRSVRHHAIRRGDDALFPRPSAGGRSSPQVQDCVRRLPERPRARVDSRSRVVRPHRRRDARLPPHHRRRHLHSADLRLPALRLPARRADARSGGSDRSRLSPVRRLQASPAQPDEVPHQGPWVGGLAPEVRRGARGGSQRGRRAVQRERHGCRRRTGADLGTAAGAIDRRGEAQPRPASKSTARASCRDR